MTALSRIAQPDGSNNIPAGPGRAERRMGRQYAQRTLCRPDDPLDAGITDAAPGLNQAAERPRRDQPKEPRQRFATCCMVVVILENKHRSIADYAGAQTSTSSRLHWNLVAGARRFNRVDLYWPRWCWRPCGAGRRER